MTTIVIQGFGGQNLVLQGFGADVPPPPPPVVYTPGPIPGVLPKFEQYVDIRMIEGTDPQSLLVGTADVSTTGITGQAPPRRPQANVASGFTAALANPPPIQPGNVVAARVRLASSRALKKRTVGT